MAGIVAAALERIERTEQLDFVARHIDARLSLDKLGAGVPEAFVGFKYNDV